MEFFSDATYMKGFEIVGNDSLDSIKVNRISGIIEIQKSIVDRPVKISDMPGFVMEHVLEKSMRCIFLTGDKLNLRAIVSITLASAQKRQS